MSEISREETINIIEKLRACRDTDLTDCECECDKCENSVSNTIAVDAMKQAISDIEKLQKIEEIVGEMWDENSYYNNTVRFAEKIEQIVRGDVNE